MYKEIKQKKSRVENPKQTFDQESNQPQSPITVSTCPSLTHSDEKEVRMHWLQKGTQIRMSDQSLFTVLSPIPPDYPPPIYGVL